MTLENEFKKAIKSNSLKSVKIKPTGNYSFCFENEINQITKKLKIDIIEAYCQNDFIIINFE